MLKSGFRIAGEVLVIATLAGSAAAQSPRAPINTLNDLEAALLDCWVPPPIEQSRPGMQITVLMSFKRNGELFGQPRITFQSSDASDAERASYRTAVVETLKPALADGDRMQLDQIKRREFIALLGGAAAACPFTAGAQQQPAMPVVGFIRDVSAEANARNATAFRKGLNETGYLEGQNVTVE